MKISIHDFFKQSIFMFIAIGIANISNLLYHLFMVRRLDTPAYGVLNSIIALVTVIGIPALSIQMGIAKFVSHYFAKGELDIIAALKIRMFRRALLLGGCLILLTVIFHGLLTDYLNLPNGSPILSMGIAAFLMLITPVFLGILQGFQRFDAMGTNVIASSGLKLLFGILLVVLGFGATGAINAISIGSLAAVIIANSKIRPMLKDYQPTKIIDLTEIYKYFIPVALSQLCFVMLTQFNIVLVKHFFNPSDAGIYSVASMTGRIILFLPMAIGVVMFPKSSYQHALNTPSYSIFKKSILSTAVICVIASFLCISYPKILVGLFSVKDIGTFTPLSSLFALSMIFYALLNIIIFYMLAVHNFKFLTILTIGTIMQTLCILIFHSTLSQVMYIVCLSGAILFTLGLTAVKSKN